MRARYSIGAVTFARLRGGRAEYVCLMNEPRVRALRAAFMREPVVVDGEVLYLYTLPSQGGDGLIAWEDVRWDTAGERVTG